MIIPRLQFEADGVSCPPGQKGAPSLSELEKVDVELTEEQLVWGTAAQLLRRHGSQAATLVRRRIEALITEEDALERALWQVIGEAVEQLGGSSSEH